MDLHYVINETMRPLAEFFFLPSIPKEFNVIEHHVQIATSANFMEDNFCALMEERTRLIGMEIAKNLDGELMLWCDVDIVFFAACAEELFQYARESDLLFQAENNWNDACNFGFQLIRRNERTLDFYQAILSLQRQNANCNDQDAGNQLLHSRKDLKWSRLPTKFSAESNGGCLGHSVLYHANCTAQNSLRKKMHQLQAACILKGIKDIPNMLNVIER
jgi:hypothetical protein